MNTGKFVSDTIEHMGATGIGGDERTAIIKVLNAAADYGYGNMIAWLATAWAAVLNEQGIPEDPESFAGGRCYPLPPAYKAAPKKKR